MENEAYKYVFSEILRMSNDGFIVVDPSGAVMDINERYCRFLGRERDSIVGRPITDIIPNSKMQELMAEGSSEELAFHKYVPGYTSEPDNDFVLVSRSCVFNDRGETVGGVAQVHFRQQAIQMAKRMMREYNELEFYKEQYENSDDRRYTFRNIVGSGTAFQEKVREGVKASKTNFPVLLTGETGTGKEVFARAIHNTSGRAGNPMVCINCAAIPAELLESELFGYEEGAFTGAKKGGKKGKFQMADRGTIFLDEIGDMPLMMQAKLLRVLQEKEIDPVGGRSPIPIDVRVISATRRDLSAAIRSGEFREDLYYRLNVINIDMIPLRERPGDIPELAEYFLARLNGEYKQAVAFQPSVLDSFRSYDWPGNLRELDNVIKGAYATCDGITIDLPDLPAKFHRGSEALGRTLGRDGEERRDAALLERTSREEQPLPMKERLERIEWALIQDAYRQFNSVRKAADYLGMSMATFVRKKNGYAEKFGGEDTKE